MSRRIETAGNIIAEILNYMPLIALQAILFHDIVNWQPGLLHLLVPVFLPVLFYLMREFCGSRILFFGIHILVPWLYVVLWGRNLPEKVIFGASAAFVSILSIHRRLSREGMGGEVIIPIAAAGMFCALYLLDAYQAQGQNAEFLTVLMICYALLYFLYLYLMRFLQYMDVNHRTTGNIPMNRAFGTSFGMVVGFLGISAVAICLGADGRLFDMLGGLIRKGLLTALSFLVSLLPRGGEEAQEIITQTAHNGGGMMMLMEEESGPTFLSKLLDGLFFLVSAAITAAACGAVILAFVRLVNAAFGGRIKRTAREQAQGEDRVEKMARPRREREKKSGETVFFAARTPQQIMRRLYYVSLRRKYYSKRDEKEERLIRSGTARECCKGLFRDKERPAEEFARLYERARYGKESCTREDAKQMKRLSGELLK